MAKPRAEAVVQTGITATLFTTKFEWKINNFMSEPLQENAFLIRAFGDTDILCEAAIANRRFGTGQTFSGSMKLVDQGDGPLICTCSISIKSALREIRYSDKKTFQLTSNARQFSNMDIDVADDIVVSFDIEIIREDQNGATPPMSFSEFASPLFNDKLLSDVTIVCQDKSFACHKLILSGRSEIFKKMLTSGFRESSEGKIEITVFEPDVVEQLIKYIYEDSVAEDALTWDLFEAAKMYEVARLQRLCLSGLRKGLNVENCCGMLEATFVHDLNEMFECAMGFFNENRAQVAKTEGWKQLVPNNSLLAKIILYDTNVKVRE